MSFEEIVDRRTDDGQILITTALPKKYKILITFVDKQECCLAYKSIKFINTHTVHIRMSNL